MSDTRSSTPHFLRVARALAGVRGATVPLAAITTVVMGTYGASGCADMGATGEPYATGGSGGAASSSSISGSGGHHDAGVLGVAVQDGG